MISRPSRDQLATFAIWLVSLTVAAIIFYAVVYHLRSGPAALLLLGTGVVFWVAVLAVVLRYGGRSIWSATRRILSGSERVGRQR